MAGGDPTAKLLGVHSVSGASLKTAIDAITAFHPLLSGSSLHLVPTDGGQVSLIQVDVEGAG